MNGFISLALIVVAVTSMSAEPVKPAIRNGNWHIPFRHWSHLSPVLEGTGGFDFLCEVQELGKDVPVQTQGAFQFRTGTLKVVEVLHADTKTFPALKELKTLTVEGCEGLKVGDQLIVFVDGEPYEGGYVIDRHRGTNCLLGHRLGRVDEDDVDKASETLLIDLVRKGKVRISHATPDELRILALMDSAGVAEILIRDIENGRLIKRPDKPN